MIQAMSNFVLPAFYDFWNACDDSRYLYKILYGGRNSSKSTHVAIRLIYMLMKEPINALVIRKVAVTLETSVFEQLLWAIDFLHVTSEFRALKNPLRIIYRKRGNMILFMGADKPEKIKSLKTSKFPVTAVWFEEMAEFKTEDEVSVIVNSVVRAELKDKLKYDVFGSYNPPKRKQHWLNKKFGTQFLLPNTFTHYSTYLDNPYVSRTFVEEANGIKNSNQMKYDWEYLGKPIGSGVVPFNNLQFRTISDSEIATFDNIRQGLDFGYATDPLAFVRMHYDKKRRTIYIFDEKYGVKIHNRVIAAWIKKKHYTTSGIIADSAEPKSIDEIKGYSINIKGAQKGPDSVEYGEKWLDDLDAIIIDPIRCPKTAQEFESIDYQTDRDGNPRPKLEDKNNHSIDATRYAMEDDMQRERSWRGAF